MNCPMSAYSHEPTYDAASNHMLAYRAKVPISQPGVASAHAPASVAAHRHPGLCRIMALRRAQGQRWWIAEVYCVAVSRMRDAILEIVVEASRGSAPAALSSSMMMSCQTNQSGVFGNRWSLLFSSSQIWISSR